MSASREGGPDDALHADLTEIRRLVHDLSNVLVAVRGFAEIVAGDARDGTVDATDAEQAVAATRRAIELVEELQAALDGRRRDGP